jgi:hypothetical protein
MISIDPGKKGCIVRWDGTTSISITDNPYIGNKVDIDKLYDLIKPALTIVVEDVHTSPRMGVVGAGGFMYSLGAIHALSKDKKLVKLPSKRWKNVMGMYGKPKPYALEVVKRLMPEQFEKMINPYPNRVDRAEAMLMGLAYFKLAL